MMRLLTLLAALIGLPIAAQQPDTVVTMEQSEVVEIIPTYSPDTISVSMRSPYHWKAELMASTSSGHTPFWLMNNRMGLSSIEQNNGYLRGGFFRDMTHDRRFSWGFGVDLVVPYHFTSHFVIQQLYGEIRYRSLELTVGSKHRYMGLVNQELGSGDLTFSQNARPVPQVYLAMPRYEWVPLTNNWLAFKGFFSMGMLTDWRWQRNHAGPLQRHAENVLYHSKGLFLRGGNLDRFPLTIEGGLEMASEFGGTVYSFTYDGKPYSVKMGHSLKDIIKAIIPTGGGNSSDPNQAGEISNVYGNHVGQWSAAVTYAARPIDTQFRFYYQHYFEDHSMMFFDHAWRDGLFGFEVTLPRNRFVSQIVYEYLTTKDQSGAVYWDKTDKIPEQVSGRDDYYNHYLYPGWSHWGMGMGNPLVISPIYNTDGSLTFHHNRIKGHHFGLKGNPTDELSYRLLMSYTRSWGTYSDPTPTVLHNFNALLEADYAPRRIPGWNFKLGLAADGGRLLGKSFGAMLTITKTGWL